MYIAYYAADNQYEEFDTFEEAKKWLSEFWERDGADNGFAEETISGQDFIAKISHESHYHVIGDKEKDGYVWDEEKLEYVNSDGEFWPVSNEFDSYGEIILKEI